MKRCLFFFLLLPWCTNAGQFVLSSALGLTNQPGWNEALSTTYYEGGACWARLPTNGNYIRGIVALGTNYPGGTYAVWMRATSPSYQGQATVTLASASAVLTVANGVWSRVLVSPTNSFSSVVVDFVKTSPAGVVHDYHLNGIYLTANANEAAVNSSLITHSSSLFVDYTPPTTTNDTDIVKGNLIPNSSFEFGFAYGWSSSRTHPTNNRPWRAQELDIGSAYDGQCSARIGPNYTSYRIYSPPIRLRGTNVYRKYTLSWYARGDGPVLIVNFGVTCPNVSGFPTNRVLEFRCVPAASWTRYSTSFWYAPFPSREVFVDFFHVASDKTVWIDAVQLEEGDLTAYAPQAPVEFALGVGRNGNLLNLNEPRLVQVHFYNTSDRALSRQFNYEVFDWMNRCVDTGAQTYWVPPGRSTNVLTLNTTNLGTSRMVAWLTENPVVRDELVFHVVPLPASPSLDTNSVIGTHGNFQTPAAASNFQWGFVWNRSLSPGGFFRWASIEPTEGSFNWTGPDFFVNAVTNYNIILGSLQEGTPPAWALTNGFPRLDRYSNYIFQVVNRYKDRIRYWEDWNEPVHWTSNQYAALLEQSVGAVKAADSNAYFIAYGGFYDLSVPYAVWALLSETAKSKIDAVSMHAYPQPQWMLREHNLYYRWWKEFGDTIGKAVWFTEGGVYGMGNKKSDVMGWISSGVYPYAHAREEVFRRGVYQSTELLLRQVCRTIGHGFARHFYYDSRLAEYNSQRIRYNFTLFNCDDSLNTQGATLLWFKHFIDPPQAAYVVTNVTHPYVEAYVFKKGDNVVLVVWNQDRTNRSISLTNGAFAVYDAHGNLLQTNQTVVRIGRMPRYWVSGTLTTNQMMATFRFGTVTAAVDDTAPTVSIDSTPHGVITERHLPLRFRWTAVDDTYVNVDSQPENVVTRYKIDGLTDWSDWSAERFVQLDSLPAGRFSLSIQAKDAVGNTSEIITGPSFETVIPLGRAQVLAPKNLRIR